MKYNIKEQARMEWSQGIGSFHVTPGVVFLLFVLAPVHGIRNHQFVISGEQCLSSHKHYILDGAVVLSQKTSHYTKSGIHCSISFKTSSPGMRILIHFKMMDIHKNGSHCSDWLSLYTYNSTNKPMKVLDKFCGSLQNLPVSELTYANGEYLNLTWHTGQTSGDHQGFMFTMAAVSRGKSDCGPAEFRCASGDCISADLVCDQIAHCMASDDERGCHRHLSTALVPTLSVSPSPPSSTEVYLWMPLIVVVLFTGVLVILIMVGRRSHSGNGPIGHRHIRAGDSPGDTERLSPNFNPAYLDSDSVFLEPSTPPPSYTSMERQISYVSQISMTSDQISIPPTYDEAEDYPSTENSNSSTRNSTSRRRTSRQHSRNSSSGSRGPPPAPSSGTRHSSTSAPTFRLLSSSSMTNNQPNSPIEPLPEHSPETSFLTNADEIDSRSRNAQQNGV